MNKQYQYGFFKKIVLKATGLQLKYIKNFPLEIFFLESVHLTYRLPLKKGHQESPLLETIHNYFHVNLCLEKHFSRPDITEVHGFVLASPK